MRAYLIDIYRSEGLVLWLKTPDGDTRLDIPYTARLYIDAVPEAEKILRKAGHAYRILRKRNYLDKPVPVLEVRLRPRWFEGFVSDFEKAARHRITIYNADVKPEQDFLYSHGLVPFGLIEIDEGRVVQVDSEPGFTLTRAEIYFDGAIATLNGKAYNDLARFAADFNSLDPDVVAMPRAFYSLPRLAEYLAKNGILCNFHRWDPAEIKYRGGKTFFSYGRVAFRDYAVRLHGRFLVDLDSSVGSGCETDAIIELCQLSGTLFQQVASRSFGAVFQQSLVRKMVEQDILIPYKEKPVERPMSMHTLVKADRVGHTFDPLPGVHEDVAEIDFSSMYPWIMFNRNISAETLALKKPPYERVPGLPFKISLAKKGLVPQAIKAILDRRMHYKKNPSAVNKAKAAGLKWVLVSSYGYCRFREFKLGIATTHMAIGAFSREIILEAAKIAEERGFEVVHGIIDSLYLRKRGLAEQEVRDYCREVEAMVGIPVSFEGIFKWIVMLPSINDSLRPLPAKYYGAFRHGGVKVRGIVARQASQPMLLRDFQRELLEKMAEKGLRCARFEARRLLDEYKRKILAALGEQLCYNIRLSRGDYKSEIPQRAVVLALKKKGITVQPGFLVRYVLGKKGAVLLEEYNGKPDALEYESLLERAAYEIVQPLGITKEELQHERQSALSEYRPKMRQVYIHCMQMPDDTRGFSEKIARRKLEQDGWIVWRGGFINALDMPEVYPNVRKKYELLEMLLQKHHPGKLDELKMLCSVHHGMPDLLCFRKGVFKFVECKLIYEQASSRQKKCISRLTVMGFDVELHRIVDHRTKAREAEVDIMSGEKNIVERQMMIREAKV